MAVIDRLYFYDNQESEMDIVFKMPGIGEKRIKCAIPKDFKDCLLKMAQAHIDLDEQNVRAIILAETDQK